MNIQEAKEQIEKAVRIYLMKDEYGDYRIPIERQRPVFLLGGYRKNCCYGADRTGDGYRTGVLFHDASHKTECAWPAVYQSQKLWRNRV